MPERRARSLSGQLTRNPDAGISDGEPVVRLSLDIIVEGRLVSPGDQDGSSHPRMEIMAERIVPILENRKR